MEIIAEPIDGGKTKKAKLKGSSVKLTLDRNKTYDVTVKWMDYISAGIDQVDKGTWSTYPTWRIKSTNKCTYTTPE